MSERHHSLRVRLHFTAGLDKTTEYAQCAQRRHNKDIRSGSLLNQLGGELHIPEMQDFKTMKNINYQVYKVHMMHLSQ